MRNTNVAALSAANVNADHNSSAIDASQLVNASVQVLMTGSSPTGTVKVQASNDLPFAVTWTDITSISVAVSAATSYLIPKFDVSYQWIRVVYAHTSGTGTVSAVLSAKGF
jgi:hypothetical protein